MIVDAFLFAMAAAGLIGLYRVNRIAHETYQRYSQ